MLIELNITYTFIFIWNWIKNLIALFGEQILLLDLDTKNGSTLLISPPKDSPPPPVTGILSENIWIMTQPKKVKQATFGGEGGGGRIYVFFDNQDWCHTNGVLSNQCFGTWQHWSNPALSRLSSRADKIFVTCLVFSVVLTTLPAFFSVSHPPWNFDPRLLT